MAAGVFTTGTLTNRTTANGWLILEPPSDTSITFNTGYVDKAETHLDIICHDQHFLHCEIRSPEGAPLFTFARKKWYSTWNIRRSLYDRTGAHVLDLRHHHATRRLTLRTLVFEDPHGKELCGSADVGDGLVTVMHHFIPRASGVRAFLQVWSYDRTGSRTIFEADGVAMAEMVKTADSRMSASAEHGGPRSAWTVRIAGGVDSAMILGMALARIEVAHIKKR